MEIRNQGLLYLPKNKKICLAWLVTQSGAFGRIWDLLDLHFVSLEKLTDSKHCIRSLYWSSWNRPVFLIHTQIQIKLTPRNCHVSTYNGRARWFMELTVNRQGDRVGSFSFLVLSLAGQGDLLWQKELKNNIFSSFHLLTVSNGKMEDSQAILSLLPLVPPLPLRVGHNPGDLDPKHERWKHVFEKRT